MSPYFALYTVENNKNKRSVKFQGDMLNFCDFIQVFVFTRNHHHNPIAFRTAKTLWSFGRSELAVLSAIGFRVDPIS